MPTCPFCKREIVDEKITVGRKKLHCENLDCKKLRLRSYRVKFSKRENELMKMKPPETHYPEVECTGCGRNTHNRFGKCDQCISRICSGLDANYMVHGRSWRNGAPMMRIR